MLGRRKDNAKGFDMLGRRNQDGTQTPTGEQATTDAGGPRMYRTDNAMTSPVRPPVVEAPRRAADVTAVTGRRPEVQPSSPDDRDSKRLVVGRGIALSGEIRACDRLIVEGQVEATLSDSRSIEISTSGVFKGKAQIEEAEISGRFDGELVVNHKLIIHNTGRVVGSVRYGEIEIARGGIISGQIDVISPGAVPATAGEPAAKPAAEPDATAGAPAAQGELTVN